MTTMSTREGAHVVATPMRESRYAPIAATTKPTTTMTLYSPVRASICPAPMLVTMAPSMSGMRMTPELVADLPSTPCTKSGRNMMAPYMAGHLQGAGHGRDREDAVARRVAG